MLIKRLFLNQLLSADVLLYWSEAFLPFLLNYYSVFYQEHQPGDATDSIYTALLVQ